jgi:amino acid transporter
MSRVGDLPKQLAHLGPGKNPWLSVLFVGLIATIVSFFFSFESAIAVSSFGTLFYYSITNLSILKLQPSQQIYPRALTGMRDSMYNQKMQHFHRNICGKTLSKLLV